jgi:hypothetical protein
MAKFRRAIVMLKVETHWYLSAYPQVRQDIKEGKARNALDHYRKIGMFRGFIPVAPDFETWYLARNRDVAAAIKSGRVRTAIEHYVGYGAREGRPPSPAFVPNSPAISPSSEGNLSGLDDIGDRHFRQDRQL